MNASNLAKMPRSTLVGRILGLVVLLATAVSSGAVIGIANASGPEKARVAVQGPAAQAPQPESFESVLAVSEPPSGMKAGDAQIAVDGSTSAARSGRRVAAPVLNLVVPGLSGSAGGGAAGASAVKCSRFDDAKINWLLDQVAKTKAENPEMSAGADRLAGELRSALGQNMCASDAQVMINRLCEDPAVVRVMNQMVSQLPFFIKPMIGNPCTADLVSVLNKAGKFVPGLASDPS